MALVGTAGDMTEGPQIGKYGVMTEERDRDGRTPLHEAVFQGRTSVVARLLEDGVDPDARDSGGRTPLHFAAQEYRPQEARLLCEGGAAINARDSLGNTPLWRATFDSRGRGEVIRVLIAQGADPDFANNAGVSPRQLAKRIDNYDVGQYFAE